MIEPKLAYSNRLKLNGDNTGFMQFITSPISKVTGLNITIHIGFDSVDFSAQAKNRGVIFDSPSMSTHVISTCKAADFNLYCLSRIKKYSTTMLSKLQYMR